MRNEILKLRKGLGWCSVVLLLMTSVSCGDDEETVSPPTTTDPTPIGVVSGIAISDVANAGDASDMLLQFLGPQESSAIKNFRVLVSKDGKAASLTLEEANAVTAGNYYEVSKNQGRDYFFQLTPGLNDTDGQLIEEGISYEILVLSVADESTENLNALSEKSNELTLSKQVEVTTLVANFQANDGLSVDSEGNIYASNFGVWSSTGGSGTKLIKVTPEGVVSDFATGLDGPLGNISDADGNIFIIDGNNGSSGNVIKISKDNVKTSLAEIPGWPAGIAMDNNDNIYVTNYQSSMLHKISASGELSVLAQDTKLQGAVGIVFDGSNFLYAANYNNGKILKVDLNGTVTEIVQLSVVANFGIGYMTMLGNHLYATGIGDHNIYKIWIDGNFEVLAGTGKAEQINGLVPNAGFVNPNGIAADEKNKILYVSDWGRPGLRKIQLF